VVHRLDDGLEQPVPFVGRVGATAPLVAPVGGFGSRRRSRPSTARHRGLFPPVAAPIHATCKTGATPSRRGRRAPSARTRRRPPTRRAARRACFPAAPPRRRPGSRPSGRQRRPRTDPPAAPTAARTRPTTGGARRTTTRPGVWSSTARVRGRAYACRQPADPVRLLEHLFA